MLDRRPEHPAALRALGHVLEKQERWPAAQRVYEQLAPVAPDPHAHVRLGWVHEQLGRPEAAAAAYQRALDAGTDDPLAAYRYSVLLLEQGDGMEARAFALAERALRQSLRGVKDAQELMMANTSSGPPSGAAPDSARQQATERLGRLDDVATDAFEHFAASFPQARTEPVLQALLRRYASSGRLPFLMGRYYEQHADTALALQHYRDAAAANPEFRDAHLALGRLYETQDNVVEAIRSFERALPRHHVEHRPARPSDRGAPQSRALRGGAAAHRRRGRRRGLQHRLPAPASVTTIWSSSTARRETMGRTHRGQASGSVQIRIRTSRLAPICRTSSMGATVPRSHQPLIGHPFVAFGVRER